MLQYIYAFYQKAFNGWYLLLVMFIMGIAIYLNYWEGLEVKFAASGTSRSERIAGYYMLYIIPFGLAFFLQLPFFNNGGFLSQKWFWIILLLAPLFFSVRVNFNFQEGWIREYFSPANLPLYRAAVNWVIRVFVLMLPVLVLWWLKDRNNQPFYGVKKLRDTRPYLIMVIIMVPLIAMASTRQDFLQVYPKAKVLYNLPVQNWQDAWRYVIFELSYGFDFLSIELFFRGFLILSLCRICGPHCIIPAACFYCVIHFGKPMPEAISSFFGGMLLGIVSYNTKSIWGGLLVHLGIAWLMELGGFIGNLLLQPG